MNKFQKIVLAIGTMGLMAITPVANAIPFNVTATSFTPGTGYGDDGNNNPETLLDVQFSASGSASRTLTSEGNSFTFDFGTVNLQETNVSGHEDDDLGVTATFTFTSPLEAEPGVVATGVVAEGVVKEDGVDFTLDWTPVTVNFAGGTFEIAMNTLSFKKTGSQTQTATITLMTLPATDGTGDDDPPIGNNVPEPPTLLLLGGGLAGLGWRFRRRS